MCDIEEAAIEELGETILDLVDTYQAQWGAELDDAKITVAKIALANDVLALVTRLVGQVDAEKCYQEVRHESLPVHY